MATRINDHWLWLGFSLFFLAAAKGVQHAIGDIASLTALDPIDGRTDDNDRPEDSISLQTLRSLSKHPNPSIASAAQSLIVTRFAATPNAADLITADMASPDETLAKRAKTAIVYLQEWDAELNGAASILEEYEHARDEAERLLTEGFAESMREEALTTLQEIARLGDLGVRRGWSGVGEDEDEDEDDEVERAGQARFAGWERIPTQRPVVGEREDERRRRRREAMVVSEWDDEG